MSILHLPQTAVEVSTIRPQSIPELTPTPSTARELRSAQKLSPDAFVPVFQERLRGGTSIEGSGKKRKIIEIAGANVESKSKDKPKDFKDECLEQHNGLHNLGNTCYLNAALQCLSRCIALVTTLNNTTEKNCPNNTLTAHLREACREITRKDRTTPYSPKNILSTILKLSPCSEWKKNEQQDAAELLQIVLGELLEENSQIGKLFEGLQRSLTKCSTCDCISGKDESFNVLALNLDEAKETEAMEAGNTKEKMWKEKGDRIEDLLERYNYTEHLRTNNKLFCTKCEGLQDAEKNLELMEVPKILITQLKRYKKVEVDSTEGTEVGALPKSVKSIKLKQHIRFHRNMTIKRNNLQGIVSKTVSYALRGVIVHYGATTSVGHYKAFVNNDDDWTEWNDETGTIIPWNEVRTKEAYLLIWERNDAQRPSGVESKLNAATATGASCLWRRIAGVC